MDQDLSSAPSQPISKDLAQEIFWEWYEYEYWEKTTEWYWILGTIAVLIIVISLLVGDRLLALIILLGAFILGTQAKRPPRLITYGLTKKGIKHGDTIFRWENISSFWVNPERHELIIESSRMIKPHIYIPLGESNPEEIRKFLLPILKEQEYHGSFGDFVTEFFGF